ncbi:hypothetical protein Q6247_26195, partial [Klebsiella pneumoniae]
GHPHLYPLQQACASPTYTPSIASIFSNRQHWYFWRRQEPRLFYFFELFFERFSQIGPWQKYFEI